MIAGDARGGAVRDRGVAPRPAGPASRRRRWLLGIVSGLIEVLYLVLLAGAYRRGDLSVVYPVARGTAPLLVGHGGRRRCSASTSASTAGWASLALVAGCSSCSGRGATSSGATGSSPPCRGRSPAASSIAAYSTVDAVGARIVAPWLFAAILFPVMAIGMAVVIAAAGPAADGVDGAPMTGSRSTGAGLLAVATYVLILVAFSIAPLAVVAPLRESAIVLGSAWGALRMGEATRSSATPRGGSRASGLIVLGVVLLAFGG